MEVPVDHAQLLSATFDQSPLAISVIDVDGRQVMANEAFGAMFGYSADELPLADLAQITHPDELEWTRAYLARLAAGDIDDFTSVKRYVRKDGTELRARLQARALHCGGRCVGVLGVLQRVDERQQLGDERMRKLVGHIHDTFTLIDDRGHVLESSGLYRTTMGYPAAFWKTQTIFDIVTAGDLERAEQLRDVVLAEPGAVVEGRFTVIAANGTEQVLDVHAVNLLDDPDVAGIVLTTRNVTDQQERARELAHRTDRAVEQADRATRLLAVVSHELRNPLHAISGLADLLADIDLPPAALDLANTMRRQLDRLRRVAEDLLDADRFDAGAFQIRLQPTSVGDVVRDVADIGRAGIGDRPVEIVTHLDASVPAWVSTDPARLRQILGNLTGNAVKFTDAGTVTVDVRTADDTLTFTVTDTGRGIPADELDHVFEAFATATTSGSGRGAGLGLTIVERLVHAMQGRIAVHSVEGTGSSFHVDLPLVPAEAPVEPTATLRRPDVAGSGRVLVVEDNVVNQKLADSQLRRLGCEPVIVASGEEAIQLLTQTPHACDTDFAVVLMDHQLPGIDGLEATRRLRDAGVTLPIIGVTASATAATRVACQAVGMDGFLAKPVGLDDLAAAIARYVGGFDAPHATPRAGAQPPATDVCNPASDAVGFDPAVLATLASELGDEAAVRGLVETFLGELDARLAAIAAAAGEPETLRRAAHTLTSSARLVGALELAAACRLLERGDGASATIERIAVEAADALRRWLAAADAR